MPDDGTTRPNDRTPQTDDRTAQTDDRATRTDGGDDDGPSERSRRYRVLFLLAVAELLAMTLWFSASAVGPELAAAWGLSAAETAWLTNAVQLGFVVGALLSAVLTLSDTITPRCLFAGSSALGVAATVVIFGRPASIARGVTVVDPATARSRLCACGVVGIVLAGRVPGVCRVGRATAEQTGAGATN